MIGTKYLFVSVCCLVTTAVQAQVIVGNGGDLLRCVASPDNAFVGEYTLDYVATFDPQLEYVSPTAANPLGAVQAILKETPLAQQFHAYAVDYAQVAAGVPNYFAGNIWIPRTSGFRDQEDSYLLEQMPPNCLDENGDEVLIQAVFHERRAQARFYSYNPSAFAMIEERPLQTSFLVVHEFLWRFAPNARILRDANRFLHDQRSTTLSPVEVLRSLLAIGLVIDGSTVPTPTYTFPIETRNVEDIDFGEITVFYDIGYELDFPNRADDYFQLFLYYPDYLNPGEYRVHRDDSTAPDDPMLAPPYVRFPGRMHGYVTIQRLELVQENGRPRFLPIGPEKRILTLTDPTAVRHPD